MYIGSSSVRFQYHFRQLCITMAVFTLDSVAVFTLYREFVITSFLKCNRLFPVHCPRVEGEHRDAFPLKSERTQKEVSHLEHRFVVLWMFYLERSKQGYIFARFSFSPRLGSRLASLTRVVCPAKESEARGQKLRLFSPSLIIATIAHALRIKNVARPNLVPRVLVTLVQR